MVAKRVDVIAHKFKNRVNFHPKDTGIRPSIIDFIESVQCIRNSVEMFRSRVAIGSLQNLLQIIISLIVGPVDVTKVEVNKDLQQTREHFNIIKDLLEVNIPFLAL